MRCAISTILVLLGCFHASAYGRTPNVVIFYADDMGRGDVGVYGCKDIATPHIDALARTGVRFMNYYSAAPVCSPSRAALITGCYPGRAGVPTNVGSTPGDEGMPTEQFTIGELAKTRGYATALIGKWHLGFTDGMQPNDQGFDYFLGHHAGCIDYFSHKFYWDGKKPNHHDLYRNKVEIHEEGQYFTHLIAREAERFIDDHKDRPFLLYVPFNAPHYPMHAPLQYLEMYKDLPKERQLYAALVAAMDDAIGRIMDRLDRYGLTEDTIVFFMSDNGISVEVRANGGGGDSGGFLAHKFSLFEGGIRMPAIVSWPGRIPANEVRDQLTIATDVWPTVAEVIGAAKPEGHVIDGRSWMDLLRDPDAPGHETLFWGWNKQDAVRQGKWKVVRNGIKPSIDYKWDRAKGEDYIFLADLDADPGETTNLRKQHPEIAAKLLEQYDAWAAEVFGEAQ